MKKFSVLFVAMLIALMLFVGCENKPKERAATTEDAQIAATLLMGIEGVVSSPKDYGIELKVTESGMSCTFNKTKINIEEINVVMVLNGSFKTSSDEKTDSFVLDLTTGTQINGKGHTLYYKHVLDNETYKSTDELILDGYKLTDLDKVKPY